MTGRGQNRRTSGLTSLGVGAILAAVTVGGCRQEHDKGPSGALPAAAAPGRPPTSFSLGRAATAAEIARIDIDVNPAGVGLPLGAGTYAEGRTIYQRKCAFCHGLEAAGQGPYPRLIGKPAPEFGFGRDFTIPKTIGNYWPYPTTVYDYIHRAMPYNAPGSLTPDETYSLVAYLLAGNGVIPRTLMINARTLPWVQMPARKHFVRDNRAGGQPFR